MAAAVHWGYDVLKQMAIEGADADLDDLKKMFADEIGSTRKSDRIQTIEELIDCLERNDQMGEDNVVPLQALVSERNIELQEAISAYQKVEHSRPYVNRYQELRLAEELQQQLHINAQRIAPPVAPQQNYITVAAFTEEKRAAVYKKISQELGRSWRDLGRKLNIGEGTMDDIEEHFPRDLKSRILRLLQIFEEDECNDPRQLLLQLCRGLADCGRKDLKHRIEQIMSH